MRIPPILSGLRRLLSPPRGADLSSAVRSEQIKLLSLALRLFAAAGITTAALVAWDFRGALSGPAWAPCVAIPLGYALLLHEDRRRHRTGSEAAFLRRSIVLLGALGALWGILINTLLAHADRVQIGLLDALLVALVSTPLIAAPLSAAAAFWIPSAVSGLLVLLRSRPVDPYILLCFGGYLTFTAAAIVMWNRFAIERSIGRIVQERQNQTINLFLKSYQEGASDWLWETGPDLRLVHVSPRFEEIARAAGVAPDGITFADLFADDPGEGGRHTIAGILASRDAFRDLAMRVTVSGTTRWWSLTGRPIEGADGRFAGYRGIGSDVTDVRRAEQQVRYLAHHDSLTGLANRAAFMAALAETCARAEAGIAGQGLALLMLDLDRFKGVNDTLGHGAGDELLGFVAERMRNCLRGDTVIARLGGDEFGIIAAAADQAEAEAIARRLITTIGQTYRLRGLNQSIGVSVGIALIGRDASAPDLCMQHADIALYAAKEGGTGLFRCFEPRLLGRSQERLELLRALEAAVRQRTLTLAFQPIVDLQRGRIVTVEALCRWNHPVLGMIPPSVFIPLAEESGLIGELGVWALAEACRAALAWPHDVRVAVNVSPIQIKATDFEERARRAILATGLPFERIDLEVTEHATMNATDNVLGTLRRLREAGCHLVLDDFGAGYSALSYLTEFSFDAIKLDAGFVQGIDTDPVKAAIVRLVVELAGELDLPVTAEGVETGAQSAMVSALRIRYAQGYALGRPAGADEIRIALAAQQRTLLAPGDHALDGGYAGRP